MSNGYNIYWGDIHNHNEIGYGTGSLERSYKIASGMMLDVYAFTPHGYWPDAPETDPKVREYHIKGFESVVRGWSGVREMAEQNNVPGSFVTIPAFEWHSSRSGDYCLYLPKEGDVTGFNDFAEMREFALRHDAVAIPHHIGYKPGMRGLDWRKFDPKVFPVVDVFSEHGCSVEPQTQWPMTAHSMGGLETSQSAFHNLNAGLFFGLTASSDNHDGHPASKNEGLTGFYAETLDRNAIFDALRRRHTFATTGERIKPMLSLDGAIPGDAIEVSKSKIFEYSVEAFGEIEFLQIIRNGRPAHTVVPKYANNFNGDFAGTVSFGWGGMKNTDITEWRVAVKVGNGEFLDLSPGFSGGACSKRLNQITKFTTTKTAFDSFTSRANRHPVHTLSFRCAGSADTRLSLKYSARIANEVHTGEIKSTIAELSLKDKSASLTSSFSSPLIKLGAFSPPSSVNMSGHWKDERISIGNWYMLKVQQKNGHIAWTSPIKTM